jgi:hypothetical protein
MVRKLVLLLVALLCVLLLAGCDLVHDILSFSPFPAYLAQAVATVDMRSEIEAYAGSDLLDRCEVYVLRNTSGDEYVFLVARREFGGQRIYVLDTDLKLIASATVSEHNSMAVADALGDFFFGKISFNATNLSTTPYDPGVFINSDEQAFSDSSNNYVVRIYSGMLEYERFNNSWTSQANPSVSLGGTFFDIWLQGLGYDPATGEVYLLFVGHDPNSDEEVLYIVTTPVSPYASGTLQPIFDGTYTVSSPVSGVQGDSDSRCYYTRKGVVAQTHTRGRYMLVSPAGDVKKRFWVTHDEQTALDFDIDGNYYYIFDENNMRLYKAATGF